MNYKAVDNTNYFQLHIYDYNHTTDTQTPNIVYDYYTTETHLRYTMQKHTYATPCRLIGNNYRLKTQTAYNLCHASIA